MDAYISNWQSFRLNPLIWQFLMLCFLMEMDLPFLIRLIQCQIDFERAEVLKGEEIIPLTAKEHILLKTLADNSGRIVTVDSICDALWGDNPFGYENSLNTHIRRIREKIESNPSAPVSLLPVKGLGYRLITKE